MFYVSVTLMSSHILVAVTFMCPSCFHLFVLSSHWRSTRARPPVQGSSYENGSSPYYIWLCNVMSVTYLLALHFIARTVSLLISSPRSAEGPYWSTPRACNGRHRIVCCRPCYSWWFVNGAYVVCPVVIAFALPQIKCPEFSVHMFIFCFYYNEHTIKESV
jgi:hypothetical protein